MSRRAAAGPLSFCLALAVKLVLAQAASAEPGWSEPKAGPAESAAEPAPEDRPPLADAVPHGQREAWFTGCSVGIRTWLSWGEADRSHADDAPPFGFVDVANAVRWRNMVSEAIEVSACGRIGGCVVLGLEVGVGAISGGQFRDQDFSISGQQGLFEDSLHPAMDDDLWYVNANLGWRFCEDVQLVPGLVVTLDGLVGYQFWRERYVAEGGVSILPGGVVFPPGPVITEEFTWQGFRIGGQTIFQFSPCCAFKMRLMFMPIPHFENEHVDHLADPSIIDRATGGFGFMGDFRFCYWLGGRTFLEFGYRVWDATSGTGETDFRFSDGTMAKVPFNRANLTRHGLTLGLSVQF